jgi:hypothetical protein
VTTTRVRCQVLEVPAHDGWLPRRERCRPRDLLPWADPYIARVISRLEDRYNIDDKANDLSDPFSADDRRVNPAVLDDGWEEDAFMPQPAGAPRWRWHPPVYGGFPLLDDA